MAQSRTSGLNRRHFLGFSASSFAMLLAGRLCLPEAAQAATGGILRIRNYSDVLTLDPLGMKSKNEQAINECLLHRLIEIAPGDEWEWQLCAASSMSQRDETHIDFTLKPGIQWTGNFGELTTEDVKFSYERIADPANKSPYYDDWRLLKEVEIKDKYNGTLVLEKPFAPIWMTSLSSSSGFIVCKKAVEAAGGSFTCPPVASSGPYMFHEWKPKQYLSLVPNPQWTGEKPAFEEVRFYAIDDEKIAETGFEAGDLDFTKISISSLQKMKNTPPANSTLVVKPSLYYAWVGINAQNPQLKDPRVRKAIQMAIDINDIMDAAYFGLAKPSTGIIPPGLTGHRDKTIFPLKADPEAARKLLAQAGYPNGIDLTLDCLNKTTNVTTAQVVQANLAAAGIRVTINSHEAGTFWVLGSEKEMKDKVNNIQLIINRFASNPDPYWYTMWHTSAQVGVRNWERFSNKEYDELHEKAAIETDPKKRDVMYKRMQDIMEETGCYRFLTHEVAPVIYRNTIIPALNPQGLPLVQYFKKT